MPSFKHRTQAFATSEHEQQRRQVTMKNLDALLLPGPSAQRLLQGILRMAPCSEGSSGARKVQSVPGAQLLMSLPKCDCLEACMRP